MSSNWRVTFMFEGTDAVLVNYEDCHYEPTLSTLSGRDLIKTADLMPKQA
jgi:hypothetical protein